MTRTILIAGTASHVGKSTVAAGLCRYLANRGVSVAPFKGQNMSNNARVVVRPADATETPSGERAAQDHPDQSNQWGEIGVSQYVQAKASGITPTTDMNPVLLKPRGNGESQLVVRGTALTHLSAGAYYEDYWTTAKDAASESYRRLATDHDVIVAEGAGSIAEINLHDRDLANVETARIADASILLLVDIERGGAFASLYGTLELLPDALRDRVVGAVITKFRGDSSLLEPGIEEIEARTNVPILGVIPYDDPGLPEEDSVALPGPGDRKTIGVEDDLRRDRHLTIAVPRLPHISNATDLEALAATPSVAVEYVPLEDGDAISERADAIVIPGTKNTVDDLLALRTADIRTEIETFDGPIVGICGGYQLLGERITNASREGTGEQDVLEGIGLLPIETSFEGTKVLEQTTVTVDGNESPLLSGASGRASGYEIHVGKTAVLEEVRRPLGEASAARENVLGTYLHGLFENDNVRNAFLGHVADKAGHPTLEADNYTQYQHDSDTREPHESPYDRAATLVAENLDLSALGYPFE
ncbi:cobyric acid synthase (plasmid) [Halostagnicola larsenii XH-48]|uniref:Probable cobyric acid synthase n=1 Tax=Halostagnicola larsenii XH-48 TaxID=797299 RepID=W0JU77_9EURY|nr:cobyric acid synthase [Halostagnicola larsenii]AHG02144.1 cobyric acid synthase [Halostagnicola larsenii XH-48]